MLGPDTRPILPVLHARHPNLRHRALEQVARALSTPCAALMAREHFCLRDALERAPSYDFILFDAPPSFGAITLNVLLAAAEIVLPVPLTYLALDGAAEMTRTVEMVRTRFAHPSTARSRWSCPPSIQHAHGREISTASPALRQTIAEMVLGYLGATTRRSRAKTIFEYAPRSTAARWMALLADELLAREPARSWR